MSQSDSELQQAVLQELEWDTRVDETEVRVSVDEGVVTLSGTVSSSAKRMAATAAAHRVHGVLEVANDLRVAVPSASARTDTDIAEAVRHALHCKIFVPDQQ